MNQHFNDNIINKIKNIQKMEFCLNCGKPLLKQRGKFCDSSCAATYNNLNRKTTTKGKTKISNCIKCGKEIEVSIHTNKSK